MRVRTRLSSAACSCGPRGLQPTLTIMALAIRTGGLPRRMRVVVCAPRGGHLDCRHLRQAPTDALDLNPPSKREPLCRLFGGRLLIGNPEEPRRFPGREIPLLVAPPQIGHRIWPQRPG